MDTTTVKLYKDTKSQLDLYREYKNESYDEIIKKLIYIVKTCKNEPWRSKETIKSIEMTRDRVKRGNLISEENRNKRLGF